MWVWLGLALAVAGGICWQQYRAVRGVYRPLASRQPARRAARPRALGTEAIDFESVDRTTRRNEALERGQLNWTRRAGDAAATDVAPLADDETYAQRYHAAFLKDKQRDKST